MNLTNQSCHEIETRSVMGPLTTTNEDGILVRVSAEHFCSLDTSIQVAVWYLLCLGIYAQASMSLELDQSHVDRGGLRIEHYDMLATHGKSQDTALR